MKHTRIFIGVLSLLGSIGCFYNLLTGNGDVRIAILCIAIATGFLLTTRQDRILDMKSDAFLLITLSKCLDRLSDEQQKEIAEEVSEELKKEGLL